MLLIEYVPLLTWRQCLRTRPIYRFHHFYSVSPLLLTLFHFDISGHIRLRTTHHNYLPICGSIHSEIFITYPYHHVYPPTWTLVNYMQ